MLITGRPGSGVTESLLGGGGKGWGGQTFIGGGQEDGIAMKGAQSKVKWGGGGNAGGGGGHDVNEDT